MSKEQARRDVDVGSPQPPISGLERWMMLLDKPSQSAHVGAVVVSFWVFYSAKNVAVILLAITFAAVLYGNSRRMPGFGLVLRFALLLIVLTVAALFSPVDVCFRKGESCHVGIKPVVFAEQSFASVRERYQNGEIPGKDFVIYGRRSIFNQVTCALTFTFPGKSESQERGMEDLKLWAESERGEK